MVDDQVLAALFDKRTYMSVEAHCIGTEQAWHVTVGAYQIGSREKERMQSFVLVRVYVGMLCYCFLCCCEVSL